MSEQRRDPIVVEQSNVNVNVIWGFLTIAFGFALWRGHQGAETGAGRLALDVLLGAALVLSGAGWISFHRHPSRLEVSPDAISLWHRGKPSSIELRRTGDLYVHTRITPRGGVHRYLKVVGSDDAIPLAHFNWKRVKDACLAAGWRLARP
jgi:hypothetical protein